MAKRRYYYLYKMGKKEWYACVSCERTGPVRITFDEVQFSSGEVTATSLDIERRTARLLYKRLGQALGVTK